MYLSAAEINKRKSEIQLKGFQDWKSPPFSGRGVFVWATGVGKTRLATHHAIPSLNTKRPFDKIIVVVPKIFLQEDWEGQRSRLGKILRKGHIQENNLKNVEVWVVNSYVRFRHRCTLLVLDEIHRYSNEETKLFQTVIDNTEAPFVLGLTATLTTDQREFLRSRGIGIVSEIRTSDAEAQGLISPYRVYNLAVDLTEKDREIERELDESFKSFAAKFNNNMELAFACARSINPMWIKERGVWEEPKAVEYAREMGWQGIPLEQAVRNYLQKKSAPRGEKGSISVWEDDEDPFEYTPSKIQAYAFAYVKYMNMRQDFLHNATNKLVLTEKIVRKFPVRTIIFSQRTAFADKVSEILGPICASYHSKLPSSPLYDETGNVVKYKTGAKKGQVKMFGADFLRKNTLALFTDGDIRVLSTAISVDEGLDVPDIEMAIITSATSTDRQNTQRIGRAVRAKDGKVAVIVNLYVRNSQDERWLKQRQRSDKRAIWIESIDEISFGYEKTDDTEGQFIQTKAANTSPLGTEGAMFVVE